MRNFIVLILIFFIPPFVFAGSITDAHKKVIARQTVAAAGLPCPTGTYMFAYNGDYTADTDAACSASGATKEDDTAKVDVTTSTSYITYPSSNDYIEWTGAADELASDEACTICMTVFIPSALSEEAIFEIVGDANDYIYGMIHSQGRWYVNYTYSGTAVAVFSGSASITFDTSYRLCASWRQDAGDDFAYKVDAGSWTASDTDLQTMGASPVTVTVGENIVSKSVENNPRVSDISIKAGWQAADDVSF